MKNILFVGVLLLLFGFQADASEIFGHISTDPGQLSTTAPINLPVLNPSSDDSQSSGQGGGSVLLFQNQNSQIAQKPKEAELNNTIEKKTPEYRGVNKPVKVLGASFYPDGSLVRADSNQIYIIKKRAKKLIPDLKALLKYQGQIIHKITPEELATYQNRSNLEGDLIRQKGTFRIYEIFPGKKKHILNLTELREHYFGLEIFNINMEEMKLY